MNFLQELGQMIEECKENYIDEAAREYTFVGGNPLAEGKLVYGENIDYLSHLLKEKGEGTFQMIYVDPPFFSKANYDSQIKVEGKEEPIKITYPTYEDRWKNNPLEYLRILCRQLLLMRELLKEDGTFWIHLDWHMVHYAKVLLDEIFGEENFINEIIWQYKSGGTSKRHFSRKHDTILLYGKTKKYKLHIDKEKSYNRGLKPYRFKGVEEFQDEKGWYTQVHRKDVWSIDMVGRTAKERTGYATQKPRALLDLIVESSTDEGDLCGDFFCGSGTMAISAGMKNRRWICCDQSSLSITTTEKQCMEKNIEYGIFGKELIANNGMTTPKVYVENGKVKISGYEFSEKEKVISKEEMDFLKEQANSLIDYWHIEGQDKKKWIRIVDVLGSHTKIGEEQWIK